MRKSTSRALQTCVAAILLAWSALESLRLTRSAFDRLAGADDVCALRNTAYAALLRELHVGASQPATSRLLRDQRDTTRPSAELLAQHRRIRRASSAFRRAARLGCTRPPPRAATRPSLESSIYARYPLDGPLLTIISVLGARSRVIIDIDDARGAAAADLSVALVALHGWTAAVSRPAWTATRAAHIRFHAALAPHLLATLGHTAHAAVVQRDSHPPAAALRAARATRADALVILAARGQELDLLRDASHAQPRVLLVAYRDFLGPTLALWRNASALPRRDSTLALDPLRGAPVAGYSLRALADLANQFGFRLVWCLRRFPIALFVHHSEQEAHLYFPTLRVTSCFAARASDSGFAADMEALWDVAHGDKWSTVPPTHARSAT